jgi:hypothetical protein
MSKNNNPKARTGEVVTFLIVQAELTTYSMDNKVMGHRSMAIQIPESDIPATMLEYVRQRIPKGDG